MKKNSLIVLMNLLLLFTATSLFAQGTIRGVIKDSLTAETLVGANVFLEGTSLGSATDIEGEYRIPRVPEGTYRLRISYIGYKPRTITVTVADNRTVVVNESLSPDFIESTTIVVSAQALGQAAAINQQKSSNTIINIDGIVDFSDPAESGKDTIPDKPSAGKLWFGSTYSENPNLWNEASPLNYVDKETPPILFINSAQKRFRAGRDEFINKLRVLDKYYKIVETDNSPHPFWLFEPWFSSNIQIIKEFVKKVN